MNKHEAVSRFPDLCTGMVVRGLDGEKLGRILILDDDFTTVEKGLIFPKDFCLPYDAILAVEGNELRVHRTLSSVASDQHPASPGPIGAAAPFERVERNALFEATGNPLTLTDMDLDVPPRSHGTSEEGLPPPPARRTA